MYFTSNPSGLGNITSLADESNLVIIFSDKSGKIIWSNTQIHHFFGISLVDVVGYPIFHFLPELSLMDLLKSNKQGSVICVSSQLLDAHKMLHDIYLSIAPVSVNDKLGYGFIIGIDDKARNVHTSISNEFLKTVPRQKSDKVWYNKGLKPKGVTPIGLINREIVSYGISYGNILHQIADYCALKEQHILIFGEKGTGKKLICKTMHQCMQAEGEYPLLLDCNLRTNEDNEQMLFGVQRGSTIQEGLLDKVDKGALYLCNIDSLDIQLQDKLVVALMDKQFYRYKSKVSIPINFRLVATCEASPNSLLRKGKLHPALVRLFRETTICNIPLRERREDIPLLIQFFIRQYGMKLFLKKDSLFSEKELERIISYDYPENISELERITRQAISDFPIELMHPMAVLLKELIDKNKTSDDASTLSGNISSDLDRAV